MKWTSPQCVYAGASLALGFLLIFLDFFLSEAHEIHDNSLWVLGQCFLFAGAIFGCKGYVDGKFDRIREDLAEKLSKHGNTSK